MLVPAIVNGDVMVAPAAGWVTWMSAVVEPSTHQEPSIWRTSTVVGALVAFARTSTSPERLSPARYSPTTGSVKPTRSVAKPRAAATGSG